MNKIVKYVCIFIILVGLYFLFSSSATYEGYLDKAQEYANLVNTGMAGTNKTTTNNVLNNNSPYGSNGIATKGYDGNGNAIFDFDKNGVPIIGYQGNTPILGTPAPASAPANIQATASAIQQAAPAIAASLYSLQNAYQAAAPHLQNAYKAAAPQINNAYQAAAPQINNAYLAVAPQINNAINSSAAASVTAKSPATAQTPSTATGTTGNPLNVVKIFNF